ncbi:Glycosyltransferase involved in cell wall bisynthesis [Belliella buryatensis]|uniref:Glycosyltransferase involved in cell wall bisynthesis n=1 Tax=Belliella buryatensis TaxID=1500549 RepID=A0A239CVM8_9BACT|nr:glycosyltransferase family A protein [Belliella buryatensis]SNS23848.1 Glycosyltransferase involved in cell wall bisynthesis [Belliella buryatensis]
MQLVSIIIPVYNKAAYINETLESALKQTYSNIELVLVNDGSTDGSLDILKKYAEKFPSKINLIDSKNKGVSAATNLGIQEAKGDYIQFLDADDLLSPEKIEKQVALLNDNNFEKIASCEWVLFKDDIQKISQVPYGIFKNFESGIDCLLRAWNHQEMMQTAAWLTHRSLIEKAGGWNEDLVKNPNPDGEFFCRVLIHSKGVVFEPEGKVYYRIPGESNVSQQRGHQATLSLLRSYQSYEKVILSFENSKRIKVALKKVYQKFIYDVFPNFPDLIKESETCIKALEVSEKTYIGGPKFQRISKIIGFKNALRLKRFFQ